MTDLITVALGICRQMHRSPCPEPCGWCRAEAEIAYKWDAAVVALPQSEGRESVR
jgi:hypothetical protein